MKRLIPCASIICIVTFLPGLLISASAVSGAADTKAAGSIAVLVAPWPNTDTKDLDSLLSGLKTAGLNVQSITPEQAGDSAVLAPGRYPIYIIPNARYYPQAALGSLGSYLQSGGRLIVIGGPAFTESAVNFQGRWVTPASVRREIQQVRPAVIKFPFNNETELAGWTRSTNDGKAPGQIRIIKDPLASGGACAAIQIPRLTQWDFWLLPKAEGLFGAGHSLLCLKVRGDSRTTQMAIELTEKDGSRWMATAPLSTQWQSVVLPLSDFRYWPDSPTKGSRGSGGDHLNPQNVAAIHFGVSQSHTPAVSPGSHALFLDDVGTAPNPVEGADFGGGASLPIIETVSPQYKVYGLSDIAAVRVAVGQNILPQDFSLPGTAAAVAPCRRFSGVGFSGDIKWRYIPLATAVDGQSRPRGDVISMLLCNSEPGKGAMVATVGINDPKLTAHPSVVSAVVGIARRMTTGPLLLRAGSEQMSYRQGQAVVLGAELFKAAGHNPNATVRMTVRPISSSSSVSAVFSSTKTFSEAETTARFEWKPERFDAALYWVTAELLDGNRVVDQIGHEMTILAEEKPVPDEFIKVQKGEFILKGKPWYPVGVNYWPTSVAGIEAKDYMYWLHWLAPGKYDPAEIEEDLTQMEGMGINLVSIHLGLPEHLTNLLDFLGRCRDHDIRVNGFVEGASPLAFNEKQVRDLIQAGRLDQNPMIFAYDIIWEPGNSVFNKEGRPRWDPDWQDWIVRQYGSIENAEKDWRFSVQRNGEQATSPSDQQLSQDGNWRIMVAAYRRFMDDLMSRKWNDATRRLRTIVPRQLLSFRQGNTFPHDFALTAEVKHIDFICPEGYAIPNSEDGYNSAGFITRYVTYTTGGKPVIWAEFGSTVWNPVTVSPNPDSIVAQGRYQDMFYRMVLQSGADGTIPWWWPGGYRTDEKSDFGILNPDRSLRPAATALVQYAPKIRAARTLPAAEVPFVADRDANAGGYWYMAFNSGRNAYAAAAAQGKMLVVRSRGSGTTSVDTPLTAVGNTPCNGHNPPQFLNAEFNFFRVQDSQGRWVDIHNGDTVKVTPDKPVMAAASVGNLQEAMWVSPKAVPLRDGMVFLASTETSQLKIEVPIVSDTPYLGDAEFGSFELAKTIRQKTQVQLRMNARNRAAFGEILTFTLEP